MAVTLSDVAVRAGVSAATVSRVLNGNYPVAEPTRTRVLQAVDELEYVVNGPASALAAATSDLVGVLVNDIADPFFGIMAGAVQSAIGPPASGAGRGQKLAVVCSTGGSPEQELTYLQLLQRQRAGAVVLAGSAVEDPEHQAVLAARLRRMSEDGVQVIFCGRPLPPVPGGGGDGDATVHGGVREDHGADGRADDQLHAGDGAVDDRDRPQGDQPRHRPSAITFDNTGGAKELTAHLVSLGHRHIGYLAGPEGRTTTRYRLAGHRAALAAAADAGDGLTWYGTYDRDSGYHGTLELLRRDPDMTAVLAANDTVALGVYAALRERGLRVPEDVSVAGFDDLPFAADVGPALTTVRVELQQAGTLAGRMALGAEPVPPGGEAVLHTKLVTRASTAPPPR